MSDSLPKVRCTHCNGLFSSGGASRHIASCRGKGEHLQLVFKARWGGPWRLHVAAHPSASLGEVDRLLRDTWLECCGHLSEFQLPRPRELERLVIGGIEIRRRVYEDERTMDDLVGQVLQPKDKFGYIYDFGSSTELAGRVLPPLQGGDEPVFVLGRNEPVVWPCENCGKPAKELCACCSTMTCGCEQECIECGEDLREMGLPVTNSPRMGTCGYTGQSLVD